MDERRIRAVIATGGDVLWASVKDFGSVSPFIVNTERKVTADALAETRLRTYPANTVLISARGTVGLVALTGEKMTFNQSCFGLRGRAEVDQSTLFEIVKTAVETLRARAHGSVFSTITRSTFADVRVRLPGSDELAALEERLSPLHAQILSLTREAAVLADVRRALLPKLFAHGLELASQAPVRVPLEPAAA